MLKLNGPMTPGTPGNLDPQGRGTILLDGFRRSCAYLGQQAAERHQPLTACGAGVLAAFDSAKIVAKRHLEGVAQREMQYLACGRTAGDAAESLWIRGLAGLRRSRERDCEP